MSNDDDDSSTGLPDERPILRTGRTSGGDGLVKKGALLTGAAVVLGAGAQKGCEFGDAIQNGTIGNYFQQANELAADGNDAGRKPKIKEIEPFDPLKEKDKRDRQNER